MEGENPRIAGMANRDAEGWDPGEVKRGVGNRESERFAGWARFVVFQVSEAIVWGARLVSRAESLHMDSEQCALVERFQIGEQGWDQLGNCRVDVYRALDRHVGRVCVHQIEQAVNGLIATHTQK